MNCCCGQLNMPMMMNPYINPFMGMSLGTGIFGGNMNMFGNSMYTLGTPYCSLFSGLYDMPSVSYYGGNSLFMGSMNYNPFMFGYMSPVMPVMNIFQQTMNLGSRLGQTISDNWSDITEFFRKNNPAPQLPALGGLTLQKNTTNKSQNGKCRPAAGKKLGKSFLEEVKNVAKRINCDYRDLLAVMNGESGLNPHAVNPHGGATGLIQFMPKTAERLGTSTEALKNMSAEEQLPYVEKFLMRCKKAAGFSEADKLSGGDLYALVFLPARAKREILCEKGEGNRYYESNAATDLNKDGKITKSELQQRIEKRRVDETIFA